MSSISIIIATYNAEMHLQGCLNSLKRQAEPPAEIIIIDGGSHDRTVEIIKRNQGHINYWISEPDQGIYDAWNKGLGKATGDWIMFLGADDQLLPSCIKEYNSLLKKERIIDEIDFISSRVCMIDKKGKAMRIKGWPFEWPLFLNEMTVAHPGALHSRRLFEKYGKYNTDYKIVGDYELLLRAGASLKTLFLNEVTVLMGENGTSNSLMAIKEHYTAITQTGEQPKYKAFLNACIVSVKYLIRTILRHVGYNIYLRKA